MNRTLKLYNFYFDNFCPTSSLKFSSLLIHSNFDVGQKNHRIDRIYLVFKVGSTHFRVSKFSRIFFQFLNFEVMHKILGKEYFDPNFSSKRHLLFP